MEELNSQTKGGYIMFDEQENQNNGDVQDDQENVNEQENQDNGDVQRTGGEAELQKELKEVDEQVGENINDQPYSEDDRQARRRGKFIDLYEDEDGDPQTTEATYREEHGEPDDSVDSTQ
jgi:hypothetical protein